MAFRPSSRRPPRSPRATEDPASDRPRAELLNEARDRALRRLGMREHSRAELRSYLQRRELPDDVIDEVLNELVSRDYVSDERYARALVREQSRRGKGPRYIQQKLSQKGVRKEAREITEIAESASGESLLEQAVAIVERRYPGWREDPKEAQRAYSALVRRGFSFDIAREALKGRGSGT